jgi:hypothetical protein
LKSGSWRRGAWVNLSFSMSKAFSCRVPQEKGTLFFVSSFNYAAMVLKSFTKW